MKIVLGIALKHFAYLQSSALSWCVPIGESLDGKIMTRVMIVETAVAEMYATCRRGKNVPSCDSNGSFSTEVNVTYGRSLRQQPGSSDAIPPTVFVPW